MTSKCPPPWQMYPILDCLPVFFDIFYILQFYIKQLTFDQWLFYASEKTLPGSVVHGLLQPLIIVAISLPNCQNGKLFATCTQTMNHWPWTCFFTSVKKPFLEENWQNDSLRHSISSIIFDEPTEKRVNRGWSCKNEF